MQKYSRMWPILVGLATLLILSLATAVLKLSSSGEEVELPNFEFERSQESDQDQESSADLQDQPFGEMTIPYLRQKEYQSSLSELQQIADNVRYTTYLTSYTSDGLKVNGLLTRPKGETPEGGWPAIVFIHGYIAPTIYRTEERYLDHLAQLAQNGFVVFKIDLRGHDQSEGEAGGAYYSADYVSDALYAYAALEKADFVNSSKIGLWGHSMAGNVVLRSMAAKPSIPAAVIWAGAVYSYEDFQKYGLSDTSYRPPAQSSERQRRRQELFDTYGEFSTESEFWRQVAPTNYLSDLEGAVQLHHATDDTVVSINYSRDLVTRLAATQVTHELFEYAQGGHNITGSSFTSAMQRTIDFFKANL